MSSASIASTTARLAIGLRGVIVPPSIVIARITFGGLQRVPGSFFWPQRVHVSFPLTGPHDAPGR